MIQERHRTAHQKLVNAVVQVVAFVALIADMTTDGECTEHGSECDGLENDCALFEMTNDDAVMTLNELIATARELRS